MSPPRLLLASGSPRRRELLARLGVPFEVRRPDVSEVPRPGESPSQLVARLALEKARAGREPGAVALGADTVVVAAGAILGKPEDAEDARRMLRALSAASHEVWTGVAAVGESADRVGLCRTEVRFRRLEEGEIGAYVASGEPMDRAGAYAIQGGAAGFVESVDGDYESVVGLPLGLVAELLAEFGFALAGERLSRRP